MQMQFKNISNAHKSKFLEPLKSAWSKAKAYNLLTKDDLEDYEYDTDEDFLSYIDFLLSKFSRFFIKEGLKDTDYHRFVLFLLYHCKKDGYITDDIGKLDDFSIRILLEKINTSALYKFFHNELDFYKSLKYNESNDTLSHPLPLSTFQQNFYIQSKYIDEINKEFLKNHIVKETHKNLICKHCEYNTSHLIQSVPFCKHCNFKIEQNINSIPYCYSCHKKEYYNKTEYVCTGCLYHQ